MDLKKEKYLKDTGIDYTKFSSGYNDRIVLGENRLEQKEKYIASGNGLKNNNNFNATAITEVQLQTSFIKIGDRLSKFVLAFFPLTLFILFVSQINFASFGETFNISASTLTGVGIYFAIFAIAYILVTEKRKLKITLRGEIVTLSSFPSFNHQISANRILSCKINAFKNPYECFDPVYNEFIDGNSRYQVNLEDGIELVLKTGKRVIIGSSNTFNPNFNN